MHRKYKKHKPDLYPNKEREWNIMKIERTNKDIRLRLQQQKGSKDKVNMYKE